MDRNSPDHYREPSSAFSIKATIQLIAYIRALKNDLVQPILTPRFAISCTDELLSSIGNLAAADPTLPIQTHISENVGEIDAVKELFPDCTSYADVYDKHGLLGPRTILAHGVHLTEEELVLIKTTGAGISHCPTSNFNLRSGMARVADMLDREIKVRAETYVGHKSNLDQLGRTRDRRLRRVLNLATYRHSACKHVFKDGCTLTPATERNASAGCAVRWQATEHRQPVLSRHNGRCTTV